jgi:hypothetical protein
MHQTTVELNTDPILTNTLQANCVHCGAEAEIIEKLFADQIHWQVDQNCTACGERLRNLT